MAFTPQSSKIYQTYSPLLQPCASLIIQTADALRHGRSAVPAPIVYLPNGDEIGGSFEGHVDGILSTLFIQDGYVASASYDGTVRFWDPESGTPVLMPFTNHPSSKAITSLAFSNDRMLLVGGSRDGDASVWDMRSHDILTTFPHSDAVTCVALSPMGTICITGCKNGTVAFWDIQSRQECRTPFRGHTERVTAMIFLEDGVAVSGSEEKFVYIYPPHIWTQR
jgi:WD40 repeat protein